jgi:hypothetical protein
VLELLTRKWQTKHSVFKDTCYPRRQSIRLLFWPLRLFLTKMPRKKTGLVAIRVGHGRHNERETRVFLGRREKEMSRALKSRVTK